MPHLNEQRLLKAAGEASFGRGEEFTAYVAELRERFNRRPSLIQSTYGGGEVDRPGCSA